MHYALQKREGIVLLTGDPGMGKTSLITELATEFKGSRISITSLTCGQLDAGDLLRFIGRRMGLKVSTNNKAEILVCIETLLVDLLHRQQRWPVLILDEAQTLSFEALEQVRLLTNLQWRGVPLLQIYLVGQRNLRNLVLSTELEQLHQRIIATASLERLSESEVRGYVSHRLLLAGWENKPEMTDNIYSAIHHYSIGIPRWINLICARLLLYGMAEELTKLGVKELGHVLDDLLTEDLLPSQVRSSLQGITRLG